MLKDVKNQKLSDEQSNDIAGGGPPNMKIAVFANGGNSPKPTGIFKEGADAASLQINSLR
ncbi:MAG: hypothetical protein IKN43_10905 [Selenomonadaceae bacterium]|nr:hypothetical protein [Selenomonadaceae bacterium]